MHLGVGAGCGEAAVAIHSVFEYACEHDGYAYCFADHEGFGNECDADSEFGEFGFLLGFVWACESLGFVEVELGDCLVRGVEYLAVFYGTFCSGLDVLSFLYVGHRIRS